jgi:hypothetical protein
VSIFAHTLLANCEQAGKIVQNVTNVMPGQQVDYETLWRFTLVNYNAGSGCLADAITQAYDPTAQIQLSWDRVAVALEGICPGSVSYVEAISQELEPTQVGPAVLEPTQPDLTQPDLTQPDLTQPDLTQPDLTPEPTPNNNNG